MSKIKNVLNDRNDLREEVHLYRRYIKYLRGWYHEHSTPLFENMEPVCFEEYCDNEAQTNSLYIVEVDITESSHSVASYEKIITVEAPRDLTMDQLKIYIDGSAFPIEDRIDASVDAPDWVNLEIYSYDLSLIDEKKGV